jgi:hypothetical protein
MPEAISAPIFQLHAADTLRPKDVNSPLIYTDVVNRGEEGVCRPADSL